MNRTKLIRDLVIGDGSLYRTGQGGSNTGVTLGISHCEQQAIWIDWKARRLREADIPIKLYQDRGGKDAWRLRSFSRHDFRRYWQSWYFFDEDRDVFEKDYFKLLSAAPVDEETLAILFLDNGSRGLKSKYKCYKTRRACEIEPYIERFKLSVGRRTQDPIVAMLASFGIESRKSREGTGNGEVLIGVTDSKRILRNILNEFCLKHGIWHSFRYKFDYPLSMKDVKRLSELAPIIR